MKSAFVVLFCIFFSQAFAQTDAKLRNAVFLSFEEFKNNTPSIHPINIFLEQTGEDKYTLKYQVDSTGATEKYKESLYAFSDSTDVYIKYNKHFAKCMAIGRLCVLRYYQESKTEWAPTPGAFGTSGLMRRKTPEGERFYILNANTGNISTLKLSVVKKLIADDTELLNEFNQQSEYNQERDKLAFIRRYNERHPM